MPEERINQHARLPEPIYHDAYLALIEAPDRGVFYADYPFDITPPTDAHPFFNHFFRPEQTSEVLENLGRRWQPFGGSGYFVLVALLAFAVVAALVFVLLPILLGRRFRGALGALGSARAARIVGYFTLLGLAFLLVEVSLIQQYILILGQPTLAIATVIGALLLFSGLGSTLSPRIGWGKAMAALVVLLAVYAVWPRFVTPAMWCPGPGPPTTVPRSSARWWRRRCWRCPSASPSSSRSEPGSSWSPRSSVGVPGEWDEGDVDEAFHVDLLAIASDQPQRRCGRAFHVPHQGVLLPDRAGRA